MAALLSIGEFSRLTHVSVKALRHSLRCVSCWRAQELDPGTSKQFASIGAQEPGRTEPCWYFVQVPEGKTAKNRMHPDLMTENLAAEVERLLGLGASHKADVEMGSMRWSTLLDPEGNEFDVMAG